MDIPNALFMHAIEADLEELYGYHAGVDMSKPAMAIMDQVVVDPKVLMDVVQRRLEAREPLPFRELVVVRPPHGDVHHGLVIVEFLDHRSMEIVNVEFWILHKILTSKPRITHSV